MSARELRKVTTARRRRDDAQRALVDAIAAAHEAGASLRQIGEAAGVTHTRVGQILDERKRR